MKSEVDMSFLYKNLNLSSINLSEGVTQISGQILKGIDMKFNGRFIHVNWRPIFNFSLEFFSE